MKPRVIKAREWAQSPAAWQPEEVRRPAPAPARAGEESAARLSAAEESARERGLAGGMRAVEEAYRAKVARVEALATSLQQERARFFDRVEPELVRLSVAIAEKIVGAELELRPEIAVEMVRGAMKRVRDRETLRVSVNPRDLEQVRAAREDLAAAVDGVRQLEVVEDRRVDVGGCVIESENGTLDARISTQLAEISRAVEGVMPNEEGEGEDAGLEPVPAGSRPD